MWTLHLEVLSATHHPIAGELTLSKLQTRFGNEDDRHLHSLHFKYTKLHFAGILNDAEIVATKAKERLANTSDEFLAPELELQWEAVFTKAVRPFNAIVKACHFVSDPHRTDDLQLALALASESISSDAVPEATFVELFRQFKGHGTVILAEAQGALESQKVNNLFISNMGDSCKKISEMVVKFEGKMTAWHECNDFDSWASEAACVVKTMLEATEEQKNWFTTVQQDVWKKVVDAMARTFKAFFHMVFTSWLSDFAHVRSLESAAMKAETFFPRINLLTYMLSGNKEFPSLFRACDKNSEVESHIEVFRSLLSWYSLIREAKAYAIAEGVDSVQGVSLEAVGLLASLGDSMHILRKHAVGNHLVQLQDAMDFINSGLLPKLQASLQTGLKDEKDRVEEAYKQCITVTTMTDGEITPEVCDTVARIDVSADLAKLTKVAVGHLQERKYSLREQVITCVKTALACRSRPSDMSEDDRKVVLDLSCGWTAWTCFQTLSESNGAVNKEKQLCEDLHNLMRRVMEAKQAAWADRIDKASVAVEHLCVPNVVLKDPGLLNRKDLQKQLFENPHRAELENPKGLRLTLSVLLDFTKTLQKAGLRLIPTLKNSWQSGHDAKRLARNNIGIDYVLDHILHKQGKTNKDVVKQVNELRGFVKLKGVELPDHISLVLATLADKATKGIMEEEGAAKGGESKHSGEGGPS